MRRRYKPDLRMFGRRKAVTPRGQRTALRWSQPRDSYSVTVPLAIIMDVWPDREDRYEEWDNKGDVKEWVVDCSLAGRSILPMARYDAPPTGQELHDLYQEASRAIWDAVQVMTGRTADAR